MTKRKWSLVLLIAGMLFISIGFFANLNLAWRNNLLFLGIVCGVAGMILKMVAMLNQKG